MSKGKKILFLVALVGIIGTSVAATVTNVKTLAGASAGWDDCPKNQQCTTRPKCGKYVDTNKDGKCDHGQIKTTTKLTASAKDSKASTGCNGNCLACGACA